MAEQTFRSPQFFEREIDLTQRVQAPLGVPAGVIGTAKKGPAFVPVTVGSIADFRTKFGGLDPKRFGPYAVNEFLKHRTAVTYMRVLGAGANDSAADIEATRVQGTVKNAGFILEGVSSPAGVSGSRETGGVVFITARHSPTAEEAFGFPVFTDNDSFSTGDVNLVRAMIMLASGTRLLVLDGNENVGVGYRNSDDLATLGSAGEMVGKFKLLISSSAPAYATTDGFTGVRVLTASLNPADGNYISKVLNTNPDRFSVEEHLLYIDYPVENELAPVSTTVDAVALMSGSTLSSSTSGDTTETFSDSFGRFDTRFTTPVSPAIISQPFGTKEFDLMTFEAISDGAYANDQIKISISNVRKSTDPASEFGSFTVQIRAFGDTDLNPEVLEVYPECTLDPSDGENFVAAKIGDIKAYYNFDADQDDERRVVVKGTYPNKSNLIRVNVAQSVKDGLIPASALPFGFRGAPVLKTNDALVDTYVSSSAGTRRLTAYNTTGLIAQSGSLVPPIPYRFKVTRGATSTSPTFVGQPGVQELTDGRLYWGTKFERMPQSASLTNAALNPNVSSVTNDLIKAISKFQGIAKLDAVLTGSGADTQSNNKFSLAKVALSNTTVAQVTGSAAQHMRETAYIRNGVPSPNDYRVIDSLGINRVTLATLVNLTSSAEFNRFTGYNKFTTFLAGGFDGVNILDTNASRMNDKATSSDTGGNASTSFVSPGLTTNVNGAGQNNQSVFSYRTAARIMTDDLTVNTNLLAIPGIRDSFVTDYAANSTRDYGLAMYVMDLVEYDENLNRLFDDDTIKPDVRQTSEQFESRAVDNTYAASYFPDVFITDSENERRVKVPPSVAAMGALAYNDRVGFPWFAPAGFNRGALDFVSNIDVRLNKGDRDTLQDAHINPISNFPRRGTTPTFVIFGQRTLKAASSALDRVNVRRMLLEVKRSVVNITREGFVFEQNTPQTRARWVSQVTPRLALIQAQAGIESFKVTMNETNNTQEDIENNRLRGQIIMVPTRTIEVVALDFILTNAGVEFGE